MKNKLTLAGLFMLFLLAASCQNPIIQQIWDLRTVTFDSNGGSHISSQNLLRGNPAERPLDPLRDDYFFSGWYLDNETFLFEWDFNIIPPENLTLFARWVAEVQHYNVAFDFNYTDGSVYSPAETWLHGEPVVPPIPLPGADEKFLYLKKEYPNYLFMFEGWYTDKDFINPWNFADGIRADTTFYAKWSDGIDIVSFDGNEPFEKAISYTNRNPGNYTLFINRNFQGVDGQVLDAPGLRLTLKGINIGNDRWWITTTGGEDLFTVGNGSGANVRLTIDDNLEIVGGIRVYHNSSLGLSGGSILDNIALYASMNEHASIIFGSVWNGNINNLFLYGLNNASLDVVISYWRDKTVLQGNLGGNILFHFNFDDFAHFLNDMQQAITTPDLPNAPNGYMFSDSGVLIPR